MIVVNGVPRTGTHLAMKLLSMLGLEDNRYVFVGLHATPDSLGARWLRGPAEKETAKTDQALLVREGYGIGHVCSAHAQQMLACNRVLYTRRDPRQSLVSLVRWHIRRERLPEDLIGASVEESLIYVLQKGYFGAATRPWTRFVRDFEGWTQQPGVLVVEFDDMGTPACAARVAEWAGLDVAKAQALAGEWLGNGGLFRGQPTHFSMSSQNPERVDWRDLWTGPVAKVWGETGGNRLLADIGYAP